MRAAVANERLWDIVGSLVRYQKRKVPQATPRTASRAAPRLAKRRARRYANTRPRLLTNMLVRVQAAR